MISDKTGPALVDWTFHVQAIDGIYAIEHEKFELRLRGRFQAVAHSGNVSVKAAANVLDVENQCVQILKLRRRRGVPRTVKAVNRQPWFLVHAVTDFFI